MLSAAPVTTVLLLLSVLMLLTHSHCNIHFFNKLYKMLPTEHHLHNHHHDHINSVHCEDLEECKKYVAYYVMDRMDLKDNMVIGIGSGTTVTYAVERLAKRITEEAPKNVTCIASSYQALMLLHQYNLNVGTLDRYSEIDFTVDGADEVDPNLTLIKGGGGCLAQEKILAVNSKALYIMVDYTKKTKELGTSWKKGIPVEVLPVAHKTVKNAIDRILGGEAVLRMAKMKMGPVVTDNGNFILDWIFPAGLMDWKTVEEKIKYIPGVVEVGLFVDMASVVFIGKGPNNIEEIFSSKFGQSKTEILNMNELADKIQATSQN